MGSFDTQSVESELDDPSARGHPCLHLVLRADRPLHLGACWSLAGLERVDLSRGPDRFQREDSALAVQLEDRGVSLPHAQLGRAGTRWRVDDLHSRNGTWVNGRRVESSLLSDGDLLEVGHSFFLFREEKGRSAGPACVEAARLRPAAPGLATMAAGLAEELSRLEAVARKKITVVIAGETGSGKEVIASATHQLSGRSGAFQAVNCGAVAPNLVESEFFGYRKGAFSGALEDRPGLVRSADGGTLFLDELGDLPPHAQAALLRVLQESEVVPVGGTRSVKVDLRLIVATNKDLDGLVARGHFRADLLARISGFTLNLPPLRARREDLGLLIAELLQRHAPERAGVCFTIEAARALLLHDWRLNIRELDKCLAAALALSPSRLELSHLPAAVCAALDHPAPPRSRRAGVELSPSEHDRRDQLVALLREHHGNVTAVATKLGKFRNQVNRWLKRLGIDPADYR